MEIKSPLIVSAINKDACGQCGETGLLQLCDAVIFISLHDLLPFIQSRGFISFYISLARRETPYLTHTAAKAEIF